MKKPISENERQVNTLRRDGMVFLGFLMLYLLTFGVSNGITQTYQNKQIAHLEERVCLLLISVGETNLYLDACVDFPTSQKILSCVETCITKFPRVKASCNVVCMNNPEHTGAPW